MILKYISTAELDFSKSWKKSYNKIQALSNFDKYMTVFWLLGPFILLIERDPADLWLTIIALSFLYKSIRLSDWFWIKQLWVKLAFGLWVLGMTSSLLSNNPLTSLQEAFVWIRFPLFAAATQTWIAKERCIRVLMLLSLFLGMMLMCTISSFEILLEYKPRLEWPYGDTMSGAYLSKVSLPVLCVFSAYIFARINLLMILLNFILIFSLGISIYIGERVSFLIRICSVFCSGFFWRPKLLPSIFVIATNVFFLTFIFFSNNNVYERYTTNFKNSVTKFERNNTHWGTWRGGIQQALETPILGIGPSETRYNCSKLDNNKFKWLPGQNFCSNHPHNFYIQLFAETGFLGFLLGFLMFFSIIFTCFKSRFRYGNCPMASTAFIIPLAFFFPIQQFGNFYGQWGNIFIWFAVAFALSQYQEKKVKL